MAKGYIYFIHTDAAVKIGYATNYKDRFSSIQTSSPLECKLVRAYSGTDYQRYEGELHYLFREKYCRGEWFALVEEDLLIADKFMNQAGFRRILADTFAPKSSMQLTLGELHPSFKMPTNLYSAVVQQEIRKKVEDYFVELDSDCDTYSASPRALEVLTEGDAVTLQNEARTVTLKRIKASYHNPFIELLPKEAQLKKNYETAFCIWLSQNDRMVVVNMLMSILGIKEKTAFRYISDCSFIFGNADDLKGFMDRRIRYNIDRENYSNLRGKRNSGPFTIRKAASQTEEEVSKHNAL